MTRSSAIKAVKAFPYPFLRAYASRYNWKTGIHGYKGTVVVFMKDNELFYGWSLCNDKDQFDKKIGTFVALQRALSVMKGKDVEGPIIDLTDEMEDLQERALRYFKQFGEYAK